MTLIKDIRRKINMTEENNKELRSLTWKHLWQQKLKEVSITIVIIVGILFLPYLIGIMFPNQFQANYYSELPCYGNPDTCDFGYWDYWITGFLTIFCGALIGAMLFFSGREIVKANWNKAEERARKELHLPLKWEQGVA